MGKMHTLLVALGLSSLAWAEPKLMVDVAKKSSDQVEIRLNHAVPLENVSQKWRENPHRLEIMIPKAEYSGKGATPIDKGVVQRVEVKSEKGNVVIRVLALQNPKMNWTGSADKRSWVLHIAPTEMSSAAEPPRLPGAVAAPAKPSGNVAVAPSRPVAPVAPPRPRTNPTQTAAPSGPEPAEQKLISVSFQKKELAQALRDIAQAAGMEAEVGSEVKGTVTASYSNLPMSKVLTNVLAQQDTLYEFRIVNNRLRVFGDATAGRTMTIPTTTYTAPKTVNLVSDYFPIDYRKSVSEAAAEVRRALSDVEVLQDDRLNVLFVRGDAQDVEKVRNIVQKFLAK